MKIIFLDIDGVLVPLDGIQKSFNHKCLIHLGEIIAETDARIVLSSSRRVYKSLLQHIKDNLLIHGFYIYDLTPVINGDYETTRASEIAAWLKQNASVTDFVVLDDFDVAEMKDGTVLAPNCVVVDDRKGLTEANAIDAINILNKNHKNG